MCNVQERYQCYIFINGMSSLTIFENFHIVYPLGTMSHEFQYMLLIYMGDPERWALSHNTSFTANHSCECIDFYT